MKPLKVRSKLECSIETETYHFPSGETLSLKVEVWREIKTGKRYVWIWRLDEASFHFTGNSELAQASFWTKDEHLMHIAEKCKANSASKMIDNVLDSINSHFGYEKKSDNCTAKHRR